MVSIEKYHGTGNDFVIVDATEDVPDRRAFAKSVCDRESGIDHPAARKTGADGVLFLALDAGGTGARVEMSLVQPDGSIAEMCGNGARCAAAWAAERTGEREILVDTLAGPRRATVEASGITIEMGVPTFDPADVPVEGSDPFVERDLSGLTVTAVNTGVPHAVAFVEDVDAVALETVGPSVRHADVFPEGANLTVAAPTEGGFRQRTYERGVEDETDSCGTGAVAIGAVAHRLGRVETGERVTVSPPGGDLGVTVTDDGALLDGPVEMEFGGQYSLAGFGETGAETDADVDATGD
ncbi:MAG: diaminopimelate epimerase [Haloarculaceae archaeon]